MFPLLWSSAKLGCAIGFGGPDLIRVALGVGMGDENLVARSQLLPAFRRRPGTPQRWRLPGLKSWLDRLRIQVVLPVGSLGTSARSVPWPRVAGQHPGIPVPI